MSIVHTIGDFRVSDPVYQAVRDASAKTGVDFSYMLAKAGQESGFRPAVKAPTSSATGLYQFIDQTWLAMVRRHGPAHGLAREAGLIERRGDGRLDVADPKARQAILDLRKDPRLNALMAGEFARDNVAHLERRLGTEVGATEMYLAHFLGAGGAARLLEARRADPEASAAALFPAAAKANPAVFGEPAKGDARSVDEVHAWAERVVGAAMAGSGAAASAPVAMPAADGASPADESGSYPTVPWPMTSAVTGSAAAVPPSAGPMPAMTGGFGGLSLWTLLTLADLPAPGA